MTTQIVISNRTALAAVNDGRATMMIPWPTDHLGEYGSRVFDGSPVSPAATDRAMDRYVADHIAPHRDVMIGGICAGRDLQGKPVIVVTIIQRPVGVS